MLQYPHGGFKVKTKPRTVTTTVPTIKLVRLSDGAIISEYGGGVKTIATSLDKIAYTTKKKNDRHSSNYCMHISEHDWTPDSGIITQNWYTAANPTARLDYTHGCVASRDGLGIAKSTAGTALSTTMGFDYLRANGQTLANEYFDRMRPDLTEVSVPNFLLDLGSIKTLLNFWRPKRGFISLLRGRNVKDILKHAANVNLGYQYGLIPTVSDIANMIEAVFQTQRKIRDWNKNVGRVYSRQCVIPIGNLTQNGVISNYGGWADVTWSTTLERTCIARIKYRTLPVPELTAFERALRGSLEGLGFELNPGIIWDALPFTFVIDWFLNVGGAIERFKVDTLELPIRLIDASLSYKERWRVDSRLRDNATVDHTASVMPGGVYERKIFHRIPQSPDLHTLQSLGWSAPNWNQIGLGISLGLQRMR